MGGTWQTVYGQSKAGEKAPTAVLRELKEETGLLPAELYRLEGVNVFYVVPHDTIWHCIQFCAIVDRRQPVKLNREHDASRWLDGLPTIDDRAKLDAMPDGVMGHHVKHVATPSKRVPLRRGGARLFF